MSGYFSLRKNGVNSNESNSDNTSITLSANDQNRDLVLDDLLSAVKSSDETSLVHALEHARPTDLDHVFTHPDSCTLLHIAARENSPKILKLLLDAGASPNIRDEKGKQFSPLHYAVQNGNYEIVEMLLRKGADVTAKDGEFGRTCLHILCKKWKTAEINYINVLNELLKQRNLNIDSTDNSGATPLYLAAQHSWKEMVKKLILRGANLDCKIRNKTARDIIQENLPGLLETIDLDQIEVGKRFYEDELYDALKRRDLDKFQEILNEINEKENSSSATSKSIYLEWDHGEYTLLTYACDHARFEFVELLLKEGVDVTHVVRKGDEWSPLLFAAKNGYYKVMEVLTENMRKNGKLHALKFTDSKKETALHKIVKKELPTDKEGVDYLKCLNILLNLRSHINIDAQDAFKNTPLHYAVLCDDQTFVRSLLINGAHLGIKNAFGTLAITRVQPGILEDVLNDCIKFRNNITDGDFEIILHYSMLAPSQHSIKPETDCLKFLSGSKTHKHLLRHPIIDTFLYLKWQQIRKYYFINLALYMAFVFSLTTYILLFFGVVDKESLENATYETSGFIDSFEIKVTLRVFIVIFWLYGTLREIVQFMVSWKYWISSLENWLELSILVMTIVTIFLPLPYVSRQSLSAWLILFAWFELFLILGRHPLLAVHITMFTTVSFNFLKFITMFSVIIIAFSISFYLVFQVNEKFLTYPQTLLKTIAMSTGELDFSELPISDFPLSSHLLFVAFVFLIVLVLMNLLNGLAVSDIQLIQKEAKLVSYQSRVDLIAYIESVFLVNPFQQLSCGEFCEDDDCCFKTCMVPTNPAIKLLHYLGKRTLMFRHCLKNDHRISMFPNRTKERWSVCHCHSKSHTFQLEESQIESAKSIVLSEEAKVADRLAGLESRVEDVVNSLKTLTDVLQHRKITVAPADTD